MSTASARHRRAQRRLWPWGTGRVNPMIGCGSCRLCATGGRTTARASESSACTSTAPTPTSSSYRPRTWYACLTRSDPGRGDRRGRYRNATARHRVGGCGARHARCRLRPRRPRLHAAMLLDQIFGAEVIGVDVSEAKLERQRRSAFARLSMRATHASPTRSSASPARESRRPSSRRRGAGGRAGRPQPRPQRHLRGRGVGPDRLRLRCARNLVEARGLHVIGATGTCPRTSSSCSAGSPPGGYAGEERERPVPARGLASQPGSARPLRQRDPRRDHPTNPDAEFTGFVYLTNT